MPTPTQTSPEIEWREAPADPDPTDRTVEALEQSIGEVQREFVTRAEIRQREHASLQELIETRLNNVEELSLERVASIRREIAINEAHRVELKADSETHRLELKSDGEKTLTTATIAAEKAVQAALAAAEKARDQQTIASQLATTKAEEASKEQLKQQGETFSAGIAGLATGFNDVKSSVAELRAERRGGNEQVVMARDTAADMKPLTDAVAMLVAAQQQVLGRGTQTTEQRASSTLMVAVIGVALVLASIIVPIVTATLTRGTP